MAAWTADTVVALAPDASSVSAGRGLADAGKWATAGTDEVAAWGEAKGSGSKPYQVTVDLSDGASKCSCPSRKFPCKHALGLMLRIAKGDVPTGEPPAWAAEWLEKRTQKAAAPKAAPAAPSAKTVEKRWETVLKGLDECEAFLHDAVGNGLLNVGAARGWDGMAARMGDAKALGVARRLRDVGSALGINDRRAVAELGGLGLLIEAARRIEDLGDLAHDVRIELGIPARKEDAVEAVEDVWDVMGGSVEGTDKLTVFRTWLRGRQTERWALVVDFVAPGGPPPTRLMPGFSFATEARFFPSAWPLRAFFDSTTNGAPFQLPEGTVWGKSLEAQADALVRNPWIDRFPVLLRAARLGEKTAIDADGMAIPIRLNAEGRMKLLAQTGNAPCTLFGELDGEAFAPLTAWGTWGQVTL